MIAAKHSRKENSGAYTSNHRIKSCDLILWLYFLYYLADI